MSIYPWVLILLIVAFAVGFALWTRSEQQELSRLLRRQAEKRGGEVKRGTLLYYPKLTFSRRGVEYTASALLGGGKPDRRATTTYVTCSVALAPGNAFRIQKKAKSIQAFLDRQFDSSRVETGNAKFDEHFIVKSRNAGTIRSFLTGRIQSTLLAFDETVDVRVENNQFVLTVDEIVRTESTLDRMVDLTVPRTRRHAIPRQRTVGRVANREGMKA